MTNGFVLADDHGNPVPPAMDALGQLRALCADAEWRGREGRVIKTIVYAPDWHVRLTEQEELTACRCCNLDIFRPCDLDSEGTCEGCLRSEYLSLRFRSELDLTDEELARREHLLTYLYLTPR